MKPKKYPPPLLYIGKVGDKSTVNVLPLQRLEVVFKILLRDPR